MIIFLVGIQKQAANIQEYLKRQNGIKVIMMEEVQMPSSRAIQQLKYNANAICQEIATELIRLKGHSNSKSFFVSTAHQFLEKLIHLHCKEIKHVLVGQVKQFQHKNHEESVEACFSLEKMMQDLRQIKDDKHDKQDILSIIDKLFGYLIWIECQGKSDFEKQNIFLQINCSLNYTCPLCIKKIHSDEPKSIKLIKNYSDEPEVIIAEPRTMKLISLRQGDKSERFPSLSKQSKFQSILETMKAERASAKKQQQTKQKKINKIWNMLGNLLQLDRQKYIIDHVFNEQENKQNRLLKELQQKNTKNQHHISHFCRKKRPNLLDFKPQKTTTLIEQTEVIQKTERSEQKTARSISPKLAHRKLSLKKHVKILEPISCNVGSLDLTSKFATQEQKLTNNSDAKACKIVFLGQNESLKNNSIKMKTNYYHRSFKSSKDVFASLPGDASEFSDYSDKKLNKSLKLV